ncbi:hypothetical protein [Clostridium felsineum]|uniref:Uncharacterized protein n=1 Tax=Clostridium felsineum TaxID=36839 RepID=A0A1S8LWZ0_9CLOT|nr:hypothetical protein [Clostridium felsineum]URZ08356.1 hypothetical protein CLROS_037380 [Clostridium felsineum]URZ13387.1 hypothetical protein CROST_041530 [Clostridium felsineum]
MKIECAKLATQFFYIIINSSQRKLASALQKLEGDSNSSRLRTKIYEIGREFKAINQLETKIERIGKNIDNAINKFQEVDRECAEKLKGSSYDYRKSIGLLTNTEKYGSIAGLGTNYLEKCKRGC